MKFGKNDEKPELNEPQVKTSVSLKVKAKRKPRARSLMGTTINALQLILLRCQLMDSINDLTQAQPHSPIIQEAQKAGIQLSEGTIKEIISFMDSIAYREFIKPKMEEVQRRFQ